ncbi:MAG: carbohydrate porin [Planctomycetota bacterium]
MSRECARSRVITLISFAVGAWFSLTLTGDVVAQDATAGGEAREFGSWWYQDTLFETLEAGRRVLDDSGVTVEGSYTIDVSKSISGGIEHDSRTRSLLDLRANIDVEKLLGFGAGQASVNFQSQVGPDASTVVGDLQAFSNIDAPNRHQLAEFWYELPIADLLRLKVGKVDANTEFSFVEAGAESIHSSSGFSPTIFTFPTYPDPAMSVNLFAKLWEGQQLGIGLYDGASVDGVTTGNNGISTFFEGSTDYFLIGELSQAWASGRGFVGGWHHNGRFTDFSGGMERGVGGWYAGFEQTLYEDSSVDLPQLLSLFAVYAETDDDHVTEFERHFGGGLVFSSAYGDVANSTGLIAHTVELSGDPMAGFTENAETAIELYHTVQLLPWLAVQPDLQFIRHPGGAGVDNATVASLRVRIDF